MIPRFENHWRKGGDIPPDAALTERLMTKTDEESRIVMSSTFRSSNQATCDGRFPRRHPSDEIILPQNHSANSSSDPRRSAQSALQTVKVFARCAEFFAAPSQSQPLIDADGR